MAEHKGVGIHFKYNSTDENPISNKSNEENDNRK